MACVFGLGLLPFSLLAVMGVCCILKKKKKDTETYNKAKADAAAATAAAATATAATAAAAAVAQPTVKVLSTPMARPPSPVRLYYITTTA